MNWLKKIKLNLDIKLVKSIIKNANKLNDMYMERSEYLNNKAVNNSDDLKCIKYILRSKLSLARASYMRTQAECYEEHLTKLEAMKNATER